jgi:DUF971 family protein
MSESKADPSSRAHAPQRLPVPSEITLHTKSRVLELAFADGANLRLPFEFLRVFSPSAEVRGHGPGQAQLQVGKRAVTIDTLEPVGHYGIKPSFSDGHDSGIYSWEYLLEIGRDHDRLWADYLNQLAAAGASRDALDPVDAVDSIDAAPAGGSCGHRH